MANKKLNTYVTCDEEYIFKRRANNEILLVKLDDSQTYFTIEGISTEVWDDLIGGKSVEETEAQLIKKYPKDETEIKNLMKQFIKNLQKNKIIALTKS